MKITFPILLWLSSEDTSWRQELSPQNVTDRVPPMWKEKGKGGGGTENSKEKIKSCQVNGCFCHYLQFLHNHSANIYGVAPPVDGGWHDWLAVQSPLIFLSWRTMSLLIIFSIHHPFISPSRASLFSFSYFGTDFCVSDSFFFFLKVTAKKIFPCFFLPAGLLSLSEPFLSLGRFQQYYQPSKGLWIKELSL
jgi:hypothetical protein